MSKFHVIACLDSERMANARRQELLIPREVAAGLGQSAVKAAREGFYLTREGNVIVWGDAVQTAVSTKQSIALNTILPRNERGPFEETRVQVTNETTLGASFRLVERGFRTVALNFANGVQPGGGFLMGATAQEEVLCRSSALYQTLVGDPMYEEHRRQQLPESTDWAIYSPNVPVFRRDDGAELDRHWLLSFITCAAPYAPAVGQPRSGDLLKQRIRRVLAIAQGYGYAALVLGAWGCGAFANDAQRTAIDFRHTLEHEYCGAFSEVVFAIADWSPERKFLEPFRIAFAADNG
jgi:uncharacterized protein (TIGR02452 family)